MEKVLKCAVLSAALSVLLGASAYAAPGVAVNGDSIVIDVSRPENISLPLTCTVKNAAGETVYIDSINLEGKKLVIKDIGSNDIADVSLGGAINAPKCEFTDLQDILKVSVGDYITYGGYEWRCVDIDENGPLMLCEQTVGESSFGESSLWQNSDIKTLLNDRFDKDLYAVSTVRQRQNVTDSTVYLLTDGGSRVDFNRNPQKLENEDLYSYYTEDRFFLPDIMQLEKAAKSGADLQSGEYVWTRTAIEAAEYDGFLYTISGTGSVDIANCGEKLGVRPAFYLNYSQVEIAGGEGSAENAYILKKNDSAYISVAEQGFTEEITASVSGGKSDGDLIMAFYDATGTLVDVQRVHVENGKGILRSEVGKDLSVKVMFWNGTGEMLPLSEGVEIINRGVWLK